MSCSPEQFASLIAEIKKAQTYQRAAWERVIKDARAYAQMKTFGTYNDVNGNCISVGFKDRDFQREMMLTNLLSAVDRAFAEDAQMGATLSFPKV